MTRDVRKNETVFRYKYGFTLIELLVVIAIIGLLASVVLAALNSARGKARDTERIQSLDAFRTALEIYYSDYGKYPNGDSVSIRGIFISQIHWDILQS